MSVTLNEKEKRLLEKLNTNVDNDDRKAGTVICGGEDLSIIDKFKDELNKEDFSEYTEENWDKVEQYLISKILGE